MAENSGKPTIIPVVNQKGGVGKTTTAVNLATALAAVGRRVLLVDLDPQGNASTGLGIDKQQREINIYNVIVGEVPVADAIQHTLVPGLDIIPSTVDLSAAEIELIEIENREFVLRDAFEEVPAGYDYIFIDCPPSLGLLTLNALVAADKVLVPLQCEFYALEGLSHLLKTVERVQRKLNPNLSLQGIVLTMVDRRARLTQQVEDDVRSFLGDLVYTTVIPRNVRISEAPSHGKPALLYDLSCNGAIAYAHLAREFLRQETANPDKRRPDNRRSAA